MTYEMSGAAAIPPRADLRESKKVLAVEGCE